MSTVETLADKLLQILEDVVPQLNAAEAKNAASRTDDSSWSAQEILGHLLDSAVNNHQRFVRAQAGELTFPGYEQTFWVTRQRYNESSWQELVDLWALYNRHLAQVIRHIPLDALDTLCTIGTSDPVTLEFIIEDYLMHMRHHLIQIHERSEGVA